MLGQEIHQYYPFSLFPTHKEFDIISPAQMEIYLDQQNVAKIVHLAAITDTVGCDTDDSVKQLAISTNIIGTANLANNFAVTACCGLTVDLVMPLP